MYTLHHFKKRSIATDYILIVGSIIGTLILLSALYTIHLYNSKQKTLQQEVVIASEQLVRELDNSFDYIKYLINFLGTEIVKNDTKDVTAIARLLRSHLITESGARKKFSWTIFDWITPDKKMIASTMEGVFKTPKDLSHRYYTQMTGKEPWAMHFDPANIGIPSGEWIIPIGMGITDSMNNFLGTVSTGVGIPRLTRNIEATLLSSKISFLILDRDTNITLHSSSIDPAAINPSFFKDNQHLISNKHSTFLDEKIEFYHNTYIYQIKSKKYPYTILVGYNQTLANYALHETIIPILVSISLLGTVCILLLIFLRQLLVDPIMELSHAVDRLTQDQPIGKFKKCKTYETLNLAAQIIKMKRLLSYQKATQAALKETIEIAEQSDQEKSKFLEHIHQEVDTPVQEIIQDARSLKKSIDQEAAQLLTAEEKVELLTHIEYNAHTIQTFSNNMLTITPIRVRHILENCKTIIAKNVRDKKSKFTLFIPSNLPIYYGDEIKIQQIIIGLLSRSLGQTSEHGEISITATLKEEDTLSYLEIIITDNGFGLDEEDIERIKSKANNASKTTYGVKGVSIELKIIQKLIELHQGTLMIRSTMGKGTKTIINLPFLGRNELEHPSPHTPPSTNATSNSVITFPKRKN